LAGDADGITFGNAGVGQMAENIGNMARVAQTRKAEADHRIANHLTMLCSLIRVHAAEAMQVGTPFSAAKVCTLLGEFSLRVETIAKLHQTLAANSDSDLIDLDRFLVEICSSVRSLSPSAAVALSVDCLCGQQLEPAKALPIGLIAAEMLTNAIKSHRHSREIEYQHRRDKRRRGLC
jgi:two-component sensor histidine kinase